MTLTIISKKLSLTFVSILIICIGGTFYSHAHKSTKVLDIFEVKPCDLGFIRPPGVSQCLNIKNIFANKIKQVAPVGRCPKNWRRYESNRFCMPSFALVACGEDTFTCNQRPGDSFRIKPGAKTCKPGTQHVAVSIPVFDQYGELFLQTKIGIMCGPLGRGNPL